MLSAVRTRALSPRRLCTTAAVGSQHVPAFSLGHRPFGSSLPWLDPATARAMRQGPTAEGRARWWRTRRPRSEYRIQVPIKGGE